MRKFYRAITAALILTMALSLTACGPSYATHIRLVLDASGPFISALPIPQAFKEGLVVDFKDLAGGAATLAGDLQAIAKDDPAKRVKQLAAVEKFAAVFNTVNARGHFGVHPTVAKVQVLLAGIIASARIYYGVSASAGPNAAKRHKEIGDDLEAKLKELKATLKVK